MTLGSHLASRFLRGKWVGGIYLIRLLVVTMWSHLYLVLDSCRGLPSLSCTPQRTESSLGEATQVRFGPLG